MNRYQIAGRAAHVRLREQLGAAGYADRQRRAGRAGGIARQAQLRATLGVEGYRRHQRGLWQRAVAKYGAARMVAILTAGREQRRLQRIFQPTPAESLLQWHFLQAGFSIHADMTATDVRVRIWQPNDVVIEARIGPYACDLCLPARRIVIELHGGVHCLCVERDARRRMALEAAGFVVLELSNAQVYHTEAHTLVASCLAMTLERTT